MGRGQGVHALENRKMHIFPVFSRRAPSLHTGVCEAGYISQVTWWQEADQNGFHSSDLDFS